MLFRTDSEIHGSCGLAPQHSSQLSSSIYRSGRALHFCADIPEGSFANHWAMSACCEPRIGLFDTGRTLLWAT